MRDEEGGMRKVRGMRDEGKSSIVRELETVK
jgi:hypothetical protein